MRRGTQLVDQAIRRAGLGHLAPAFPDDPSAWRAAAEGGKHPSSGYANPTLTIVALAIRLADYISHPLVRCHQVGGA